MYSFIARNLSFCKIKANINGKAITIDLSPYDIVREYTVVRAGYISIINGLNLDFILRHRKKNETTHRSVEYINSTRVTLGTAMGPVDESKQQRLFSGLKEIPLKHIRPGHFITSLIYYLSHYINLPEPKLFKCNCCNQYYIFEDTTFSENIGIRCKKFAKD
jgi:hypothetical protein